METEASATAKRRLNLAAAFLQSGRCTETDLFAKKRKTRCALLRSPVLRLAPSVAKTRPCWFVAGCLNGQSRRPGKLHHICITFKTWQRRKREKKKGKKEDRYKLELKLSADIQDLKEINIQDLKEIKEPRKLKSIHPSSCELFFFFFFGLCGGKKWKKEKWKWQNYIF